MKPFCIPSRRFGRTGLEIPILSLGGMRFQQSWTDIDFALIKNQSNQKVKAILEKAALYGLHHLETARHYGSSERQLGWAFRNCVDSQRLLQTKIPPYEDPKVFESELQLSFERLGCDRLDLLAIHGINMPYHLDQTLRAGGCLEVVHRWQQKGLIGHVGFSTHGALDLILKAIRSNAFDYINLHWYYICQNNSPALDMAIKSDMGVFIISPTDKGGHLHSPSKQLMELCEPLHPIVFNDLFCLSDLRVHTISVGASCPEDLILHLEAVSLLDQASDLLPPIQKRLMDQARRSLGDDWLASWHFGLPNWEETPGEMNIPILLWLYNLLEAWDMEGYAKARYSLLGNASHWFPGSNADLLDDQISENLLSDSLVNSPWRKEIPNVLRDLKTRLGGCSLDRISNS